MKTLKEHPGSVPRDLMKRFPSGTAVDDYEAWVPNNAGLEQCLGVAGMLDPTFYEVDGLILRNKTIAERVLRGDSSSPFGDDPASFERYYNLINVSEYFLLAADEAVHDDALVTAFAQTLRHFWSLALKLRFPGRQFAFEIAEGMYDEEHTCLTFWQLKPNRVELDTPE